MSAHANGKASESEGPGTDDVAGPGLTSALEVVRLTARGSRKDFALDARPIAGGGQATVFGAVHKPTGARVAFKRLDWRSPDALARMRREVEAARLFGGNPHVLPVLDWSRSYDWFVMPLADGTARVLAEEPPESAVVRALVTAVCEALREPHRKGWIHRDLKPDNVLRFAGRWVVADWGLGRRPRGQTTDPRRTQVGVQFGTEGFAAPELAVDAHVAGPPADIYSIGQIVGWALKGTWPQPNVPLLPPSGPWRAIVRAATMHDPHRRIGTVDELLSMVAAEFDAPAELASRGGRLLPAVRAGDREALVELFRLAARSDLDHDFFRDVLVALDGDRLRAAVSADPQAVGEVVRAIRLLDSANGSAGREPGDHGRAITWLLAIAGHAESLAQWDLLDEVSDAILHLNANEQVSPEVHGEVVAWLTAATGTAASVIAAVLRRYTPRPHLAGLADGGALDHRIRLALRPRLQAESAGGDPAAADEDHTGKRRPVTRRATLLSAIGVLAAVLIVIGTLLSNVSNPPGDPSESSGPSIAPSENPLAGLPGVPSELADSSSMRAFIEAWDLYPSWSRCRSGSGDTALTGNFPARRTQGGGLPVRSSYCTNDGNLTVMFANYRPAAYNEVAPAYFDAAPPVQPVGGEKTPPPGLHVFAWSPTQRALVWTDTEARLIGVAVTDSPRTDLVELWSRYRPR
ncbi:serine/threonine protein kinase [Acrocarpospora pleiomorpha]|nr:phosphotransferase [Acrocarpospora pleiomorpha]